MKLNEHIEVTWDEERQTRIVTPISEEAHALFADVFGIGEDTCTFLDFIAARAGE